MTNKLNQIQQNLKVAKSQFNSFGKYAYRSCEDILEAVKPLLGEATLTLSDEIVQLGDRYYVKAVATLTDEKVTWSNTGFARESEDKKGMDASQITGTASSYARKYALNGLFCIDDTKDADTMENKEDVSKAVEKLKKATTVPELTEFFKALKPSEQKSPDVIQAGKNRKEEIMNDIPTV